MIRVTRSGTIVSVSPDEVESLRSQFDRQLHIRLPSLFEPELLELVHREVEKTEFVDRVHAAVDAETKAPACDQKLPENSLASALLNLAFNSSALFSLIEAVTGCGRIGSFSGSVHRFLASAGHRDAWHDDMVHHRLVALSFNLGIEPYSGGALQIRDRNSLELLQEFANRRFGDAIVFRLADHLQHRNTAVDGTIPKIAFAGWFRSQPAYQSYLTLLKDRQTAQTNVL
jgi:hypothetical protein